MEHPKPIKVLIVEDNPDDQELLRLQLRKTTFFDGTLFLDDPLKALDLIQGAHSEELKENLVAILLDVNLPHMSGIDLLRILRTTEGLERVPVMVMTSCPHPNVRASCEELKVTAFVEKPVTISDFAKIIASVFHPTPLAARSR